MGKKGRKPNDRVNGERLRIAIKRSGMKPVEFGKRLYMTKNSKTASTNVYRLCLPDGDDKKIGLDIALLHDASKLLNVREEWLIGNDEDDIMTDFELIQEQIQDHEYRVQRAQELSNATVRLLLEKAGYTFRELGFFSPDNDEPQPAFVFENKKHEPFLISSDDFIKLESVCVDLCASMFRNYAAPLHLSPSHKKKVPEKSDT